MSIQNRREKTTDLSDPSAPETGDLKDVLSRSVQKMGGSSNCLGANLTDKGTMMLGVTEEDDVSLAIFENGIWITKDD